MQKVIVCKASVNFLEEAIEKRLLSEGIYMIKKVAITTLADSALVVVIVGDTKE